MNKYKKIFFTSIFAYCYLMLALFFPTQYEMIAPGKIDTVANDIVIDDDKKSLDLYAVSVYYKTRITPFEKMVFSLSNKYEINKMTDYQKSLSSKEEALQGQISKKSSYQASLIKAFSMAQLKNDTIDFAYEFEGFIVYYTDIKTRINLPIGSIIKTINGLSDKDLMIESLKESITSIFTLDNHKSVSITKEANTKYSFYPQYKIKSLTHKITQPGLTTTTGGPSGGMMQTLYLYADLMGYHKINQKIAGTGTIELDGTIGEIGGAMQKLYTAYRYDVKYFFIAEKNYEKIKDEISRFKNMEIIRISTIKEAMTKLDEIYHELS